MSLGLVVLVGNWQRGSCPMGLIVLQSNCPRHSCFQGSSPRGSCLRGRCPRTVTGSGCGVMQSGFWGLVPSCMNPSVWC